MPPFHPNLPVKGRSTPKYTMQPQQRVPKLGGVCRIHSSTHHLQCSKNAGGQCSMVQRTRGLIYKAPVPSIERKRAGSESSCSRGKQMRNIKPQPPSASSRRESQSASAGRRARSNAAGGRKKGKCCSSNGREQIVGEKRHSGRGRVRTMQNAHVLQR